MSTPAKRTFWGPKDFPSSAERDALVIDRLAWGIHDTAGFLMGYAHTGDWLDARHSLHWHVRKMHRMNRRFIRSLQKFGTTHKGPAIELIVHRMHAAIRDLIWSLDLYFGGDGPEDYRMAPDAAAWSEAEKQMAATSNDLQFALPMIEAGEAVPRPKFLGPTTWGRIAGILDMSVPTAKGLLEGAWRRASAGSKIVVDIPLIREDGIREKIAEARDAQRITKGKKPRKNAQIRPVPPVPSLAASVRTRHEVISSRPRH